MKELKAKTKIFSIVIILLCFFVNLGFVVSAQDGTDLEETLSEQTETDHFPFDTLPEGSITFERYTNSTSKNYRNVFTEIGLQRLREYFKGMLILPRDKVREDFYGPELSYSDGYYLNIQGEFVPDDTIYESRMRNWICSAQVQDDTSPRFSSNRFCQGSDLYEINVNEEDFTDNNINEYDPNDGSPINNEDTQVICDSGLDDSLSVKGDDGRNYIIPLASYVQLYSNYNQARYDDETNNLSYYHQGLDFAANSGTSVIAPNNGKVVDIHISDPTSSHNAYGNSIILEHTFSDGTKEYTLYAHMLDGSMTVSLDQYVAVGQEIGQVGSTGNSSGPHLHFEVRKIQGQWDGQCKILGNVCDSNFDPGKKIAFDNVEALRNKIVESSQGEICDKEPTPVPTFAQDSNYSGEITSFSCMLGRAADVVGNVPKKALYAISRNEATRCPLTWVDFMGISQYIPDPFNNPSTYSSVDENTDLNLIDWSTSKTSSEAVMTTECTGNPTQIALASRNLTTSYDVRGVSQFVDSTFNAQVLKAENGVPLMEKCIQALGGDVEINVPPIGHECRAKVSKKCLEEFYGYDNKSIAPERYSRHITSHVVCAKAIKLRFDAGNIAVDDWDEEIMYDAAWDYYGHGTQAPGACDGYGKPANRDYCDKAVKFFMDTPEEEFKCGQ